MKETLPYIKLELDSHYSGDIKIDPDYESHDRNLQQERSFRYGETCLCYNCSLALAQWLKTAYLDMKISHELHRP